MQELIESLGNNVKTISYNTIAKEWTIIYINGINPDIVKTEDLKEFLENA